MYLRPSLRGQGWGHRLLTAVTELATLDGCERINLDTNDRQPDACRLYKRAGFKLLRRARATCYYIKELTSSDTSPTWKPDDGWERLPGAEGAATEGVWRVTTDDGNWIVKRLRMNGPVADPHSYRWWRREIEVANSGISESFRGLVAPAYRLEEDDHGVTLWSEEVTSSSTPPEVVATALGTFAAIELDDPGWFSANRLRDRIAQVDPAAPARLDRSSFDKSTVTLMIDVWEARQTMLDLLDALPHVLSHGDALPRNLLRQDGPAVTAIDWDQLGYAPVGADLATYSMWTTTPTDFLVDGYVEALGIDRSAASAGLTLTTALIAVSRVIRTANTDQARGYQERLDKSLPQLADALRHIDRR